MKQQNDPTIEQITKYYNKFNEDKRLDSRHGQVEYLVSMEYIHKYLYAIRHPSESMSADPCAAPDQKKYAVRPKESVRILDIGAGTGKYAVALAEEGYDVTAVEPVRYNLGILKKKNSAVKAMQGNALRLKKLADDTFDLTLLFGPMYHLFTYEEKRKALLEAKRVTRPGGFIMAAYCMNEYSIVMYGLKEGHLGECMEAGRFTEDFQTISRPEHLYDYVRVETIRRLAADAGLTRCRLLSPDGPANYIRDSLRNMTEEEFALFVRYQLAVCEREDLIGAGGHTVDILQKR